MQTSGYKCDNDGMDVTSGVGWSYILQAGAVVVPYDPKNVTPGTHPPQGQAHFCSYACLAAWAAKQDAAEKAAVEAAKPGA